MGKLTALFLLSFRFLWVEAQPPGNLATQKPVASLAGSFSDFYVDNFQNIYLISESNQIKKINDRFDSLAVYNEVRKYGDIASLDVNNPLKIAVFYKDFATIVVLDRYLSFRNRIDLRKAGIPEVTAFSQSFDNNYWIFDPIDNTIKKIDDNGRILQRFNDFRLLFNFTFNPNTIIDQNNFIYLFDQNYGWLIFDYNGSLKQKLPAKDLTNVQVANNELVGQKDGKLVFLHPKTFTESSMTMPLTEGHILKFYLDRSNLFVLIPSGLFLYSLTK